MQEMDSAQNNLLLAICSFLAVSLVYVLATMPAAPGLRALKDAVIRAAIGSALSTRFISQQGSRGL